MTIYYAKKKKKNYLGDRTTRVVWRGGWRAYQCAWEPKTRQYLLFITASYFPKSNLFCDIPWRKESLGEALCVGGCACAFDKQQWKTSEGDWEPSANKHCLLSHRQLGAVEIVQEWLTNVRGWQKGTPLPLFCQTLIVGHNLRTTGYSFLFLHKTPKSKRWHHWGR